MSLRGYINVDWNILSEHSKANSCNIFEIVRGVVFRESKKQTILAQSTMEEKMIAFLTTSE